MRTGFFGGSFDPPHRGHLAVAKAALQMFSLDRVLFAPTGMQPLKPEGAVASFADRLAMVELCCRAEPRFEPSLLDAPRADGRPNFTVDALEALQHGTGTDNSGADDSIFVLVGSDAFLELRRWRDPERLLAVAEWIVPARPGFALQALETMGLSAAQRKRVHLLRDVDDPTSATDIRRRLQQGLDCRDMVPADVLDYIREHRLYGA